MTCDDVGKSRDPGSGRAKARQGKMVMRDRGNRLLPAMALAMAIARAEAAPDGPRPGVPVEQFVAQWCADCHGAGGPAPNPMSPKLAGQRPDYLFREMQKFRDGARKGTLMQVRLGGLENRDLAVIARYFSAQRRIPDAGNGAPEDEATRLLYAEGDAARNIPPCTTCHGSSAHSDGRPSAVPRLTGQRATYLETQLFRFVEGTRLPGQAPNHPVADRLDDAEIRSLSHHASRID